MQTESDGIAVANAINEYIFMMDYLFHCAGRGGYVASGQRNNCKVSHIKSWDSEKA